MVHRFKSLQRRGAVLIAIAAFATILSGCDTEKTRNLIDERASEAQQNLVKAREAQPDAKHYNPLQLVLPTRFGPGNIRIAYAHRIACTLPAKCETMQRQHDQPGPAAIAPIRHCPLQQ